ncbi:hypothetical protein FOVG_19648 [Fusarium oxysporum f. sp. pisi HDV247]|jgi:hypothetical protein|uniref:Uncharacterized protein n=2 Tax=Fusarium oxysporum TaxID=5507 RepID=A0A420MCH9_FUSOX|nr:hypothetical protein FOVG_19648 [Fusarium oxysporum f. sp. pisi HDV247]KAH7191547.1 hypothetical protein BKA60DRAFT_584619 [Fusarium oxysporum]RKK65737.1 hypothetical protein BFJ69_g16018 [Fusarium oxysporum]RKK81114.1 hypothetical protein BFJ71_g15731 [Fusarium oxysporum]
MEVSDNEDHALDQVENEDDDPLLSLEAPLFISGDDEETFHAKNKSMTDWQRRIVIERLTKATAIQCFLLDVIHGKLNPTARSPSATLMVFKFRLEPIKHRRRLVRARIDIEFFPKDPRDTAPTVLAIGLDDRWRISPTVDHEEITKAGKINLGLSGGSVAQAGGEASLEKIRGRDIRDATTVTGGTHFGEGIDAGDHTACGWTLLENKTQSTGLPYSLTVPVLIQRDNDKQFNAVVSLSVKGNTRTTVDWMFNKIPIDDPVLFNPAVDRLSEAPVKKDKNTKGKGNKKKAVKPLVQKYGKQELGKWQEEMNNLTKVILSTTLEGGER